MEAAWRLARGRSRRTLLAVPAEVEPAELAQLLDFAECPHTENWSLRAALVRYANRSLSV